MELTVDNQPAEVVEPVTTDEQAITPEEDAQNTEDNKNAGIVRELCKDFFDTKLKTLDMPIDLVANVCENVTRALFKIHQAKSKSFQAFLDAKKVMQEEKMNYVEPTTE